MLVPGDDGPVAVVVHARLGELELEGVRADLDRLDPGVLLDGDAILVPGMVNLGHCGSIVCCKYNAIQFFQYFY